MNTSFNENEEKKILDAISVDKEEVKATSAANKFLKSFEEAGAVLFKDQFGGPFLSILVDGKRTNFPIRSERFGDFLQKTSWDESATTLGREALQRVESLLAAKAVFEGPTIELFNRVAVREGKFWYDLGEGKAIELTKEGWAKVDAPIIFRSYTHQKAQIEPMPGGDAKKFLRFRSLKNQETECLLLTWIITCFVPEIPHAVLALFGEKGAAKSTTMRLIQELVDPSKVGLLSLPRPEELVQQLYHHYCAFYDNMRKLKDCEADVLCRAVTGNGNTKRKLFSDDEDVIYSFRRCIGLNGINNVVDTPDLLERILFIELERIGSESRRTEGAINDEFTKAKGLILGGIFDTLVKAIQIHEETDLEDSPRMADFTKWGYAISEALGYGGDFFLEAYQNNIKKQNEEVVEGHPLAFATQKLLEIENPWHGSPTEFLKALDAHWYDWRLEENKKPKGPNALGRGLKEIKSNLEDVGIKFEDWKDSRGRHYQFTKIAVPVGISSTTPESVQDNMDSKDDKPTTLAEQGELLWPGAEITDEPLKNE